VRLAREASTEGQISTRHFHRSWCSSEHGDSSENRGKRQGARGKRKEREQKVEAASRRFRKGARCVSPARLAQKIKYPPHFHRRMAHTKTRSSRRAEKKVILLKLPSLCLCASVVNPHIFIPCVVRPSMVTFLNNDSNLGVIKSGLSFKFAVKKG